MSEKYRETEAGEENDGVVALTDDSGEVIRFYHIGTIEYKNEWYAFFKPVKELDGVDPDELLIYKIEGEGKGEDLVPLEDDTLQTEVYEAFMKELEDDDGDADDIVATRGCCGGGDCPQKGDCGDCRGCRKG